MKAEDFFTRVSNRLSLYNNRRAFIEKEVILANIEFAIDFINQYKLDTASKIMIEEAIVELAVHRCLILMTTRIPDLKAAWDDIIARHKNIVRMVLKGVVNEDVIQQILEDQDKPVTKDVIVKTVCAGRTRSMIRDYFDYKLFRRL